MYIHMCISLSIYMYIYIYAYISLSIYIYICIYTYISMCNMHISGSSHLVGSGTPAERLRGSFLLNSVV